MFVSPTTRNTSLASAVNNRIKADGSMIAAKSAMWRLFGAGGFCLLAGLGALAVLVGYSYVADSRTSAEKMASAFADALEHANLGTVRLNPEATISLKPDGTVKLDTTGATVKLDTTGAMLRTSVQDVPRPTERQLAGGNTPGNMTGDAKIVTNYTIFKQIRYGAGFIVTGWDFSSSDQERPNAQLCYYSMKAGVSAITLDIARNGQFLPASENNNLNIDAMKALQQCMWF